MFVLQLFERVMCEKFSLMNFDAWLNVLLDDFLS